MRAFLLLLLAGCATAPSFVEDECRLVRVGHHLGPFPRYGATAATEDGAIYVTGGAGFGYHGRVDRFDPRTGTWSVFAEGLAGRRWVRSATHGGRLFVIGGEHRADEIGRVETVDLASGTVETLGPMPVARRFAETVLFRDRIWVIGGAVKEDRLRRVDILDPKTNRWTRGPDIAEGRNTRAIVARGTLWLFGGYVGRSRPNSTVVERLAKNGQFRVVGKSPFSMSAFSVAVLEDRYVYFFGDYRALDSVVRFDLETAEWRRVAPGYTPRRHSAAVSVGGQIHVFGGNRDSTGRALGTVETFERRCDGRAPVAEADHMSLDTQRLALQTIANHVLGIDDRLPVPVLEKPSWFFEELRQERRQSAQAKAVERAWQSMRPKPRATEAASPIPAGIYLPATKEVYLPSQSLQHQERLPHLLAHELIHALRDRQGGYRRLAKPDDLDVDRWLAHRALVEGDAELLGALSALASRFGVTPDRITQLSQNRTRLSKRTIDNARARTPRDTDYRTMPYLDGALFALQVSAKGGLPSLNEALLDPPDSTEQILHPEKYLSTPRDRPKPLPRPDLSSLPDLRPEVSLTVGEFALREWLRPDLGLERAARAAEGWEGGRLQLYRTKNGETASVMTTLWEQETEAAEFLGAWQAAASGTAEDRWRRGATVYIIRGAPQILKPLRAALGG